MKLIWINSAFAMMIALFVAGCGGKNGGERPSDSGKTAGSGDTTSASSSGGSGGSGNKKSITQKGSDTMLQLAQKWAEEFAKTHPGLEVQVTGGGSGVGIAGLINGTTQIANASRKIKNEELDQLKKKYGTPPVEVRVALDGVTIYVHESNPVSQLTMDQLRKIYLGQTTNWKDVGGPDRRIILYGRENSSGTYEFFKEHVLNKADFPPETQTLQGTAAVVSSVGQDEGGIGYGGEHYSKGIKKLKLVNDKGEAIEATEANVVSGTYPLSRTLYFYVAKEPTGEIKEYIDWVISEEGQKVVREAGYFPLK